MSYQMVGPLRLSLTHWPSPALSYITDTITIIIMAPAASSSMAVDGETKMEPQQRHWCVIGAGASGLVVMKELNEIGIKVGYMMTP